jgi:hypothetical protein
MNQIARPKSPTPPRSIIIDIIDTRAIKVRVHQHCPIQSASMIPISINQALTRTALGQRLQNRIINQPGISVSAENRRDAEARTVGGHEGGGNGTALVAAGAGVDVEGDGVYALGEGGGVDASGGQEEGGEGGEVHVCG